MKIKKIRWYKPLTDNYEAKCGSIRLKCDQLFGEYDKTKLLSYRTWQSFTTPMWQCSVFLGSIRRSGILRNSADIAKADANKIITQLLRDIRDGTQQIMDEFKISEND